MSREPFPPPLDRVGAPINHRGWYGSSPASMNQDDKNRAYASPACSLQEHDGHTDGGAADDVQAWRRKERERLIALRKAIPKDERAGLDAGIVRGLDALLGNVEEICIAVYWPIRGEPDLREWYERLSARGAGLALPVVLEKHRPLAFCAWRPGDALVRGTLNIPVPKIRQVVSPDVIVSPLVGHDRSRHRLGNGGGYYDRTLAALERRPRLIGVGYRRCAIRTIYPQPFDVPMDIVVTESSVESPSGAQAG